MNKKRFDKYILHMLHSSHIHLSEHLESNRNSMDSYKSFWSGDPRNRLLKQDMSSNCLNMDLLQACTWVIIISEL